MKNINSTDIIQKITRNSLFVKDPVSGIYYFFLYNVFPLASICSVLLNDTSKNSISTVNMYIVTSISAVNCLCDIRNRKQYTNVSGYRLFILWIVNIIILSYAVFEIVFITTTQNLNYQFIQIYCVYGIQLVIVILDLMFAYYQDYVHQL